jgi:hypothetical protein
VRGALWAASIPTRYASRMRTAIPLILLALAAASPAQDDPRPRFRIAAGLAAGEFDFETDGSALNDDTDAGMFRLSFEGTSGRGIGGGVRLESVASDDDLFVSAGFNAAEATNGTVFGHFTYRHEAHRFAMPLRAGILLNALVLEEDATDDEVEYASIGPYFEIAPEFELLRSGRTSWSLYGEFGIGIGGTAIEIDGDPADYESVTSFGGVEVGTRVAFSRFELGLAYVGRFQSMDESDPEGNQVVLGYDASFNGLLFTFAVTF